MVRVAARAEANEIEFQPTGGHPQDILVNAENYRLFSNAQALAYAVGKRLGVQVRLAPFDMDFQRLSSSRLSRLLQATSLEACVPASARRARRAAASMKLP